MKVPMVLHEKKIENLKDMFLWHSKPEKESDTFLGSLDKEREFQIFVHWKTTKSQHIHRDSGVLSNKSLLFHLQHC